MDFNKKMKFGTKNDTQKIKMDVQTIKLRFGSKNEMQIIKWCINDKKLYNW